MYLSILRLWNFRKYCTGADNEPGMEVHFQDGVNVLIGENDSGKTAIVDAIRYVLRTQSGDFFICYAPISSEKFLSLPPDLEKKYAEKFRYPETFVRTNDGIKAIPYKPKTKDFER